MAGSTGAASGGNQKGVQEQEMHRRRGDRGGQAGEAVAAELGRGYERREVREREGFQERSGGGWEERCGSCLDGSRSQVGFFARRLFSHYACDFFFAFGERTYQRQSDTTSRQLI
jgi:hypothetical protein